MKYPENWSLLSKHERKEYKRNYYHNLQLRLSRASSYKKYAMYSFIGLFVFVGGYLLIREISKPLPGEYISSLGNKHIKEITDAHDPYNSLPPTSGTHVGGKASWGISDSAIPDELQLHNLEDGGVGIQYNCTLVENDCKQLVESLATIAKKYPDKVFMAPYPKMDTKIALTAWTRVDKLNDFDQNRIQLFVNAFKGIDHH